MCINYDTCIVYQLDKAAAGWLGGEHVGKHVMEKQCAHVGYLRREKLKAEDDVDEEDVSALPISAEIPTTDTLYTTREASHHPT